MIRSPSIWTTRRRPGRISVRLAASGWHTGAMTMAMIVANLGPGAEGSLGAAGIDEMRWLRPVHPGDVLRCETEVLEMTPSRSRPMGVIRYRVTVINQADEPVMTFNPITPFRRRRRTELSSRLADHQANRGGDEAGIGHPQVRLRIGRGVDEAVHHEAVRLDAERET